MPKTWTIGADTNRAKKKAATRQRILDAAKELFEQKGFYETTTAEIAKAAKVSPGSIYAHFGSPGNIMAQLHIKLMTLRTQSLAELRESWPKDRSYWDLLMVMLEEIWGLNEKALQIENICAYHSWCWICDLQDYSPPRETYAPLFEELTITIDAARENGELGHAMESSMAVEIMAAACLQGIQEARLGREVHLHQFQRFVEKVHAIFSVEKPPEAKVA